MPPLILNKEKKMDKILQLTDKMINYEKGCPKRINHFLKVYSFASIIAQEEKLDEKTKFILLATTIVHDIGIKISLEKYNSSAGKYQEMEGPIVAQKMLSELDFEKDLIERVCFLIANHHSYDNILGLDYQILIEADFLVNIYEDEMGKETAVNIKNKYFKTEAGKRLLDTLYLD